MVDVAEMVVVGSSEVSAGTVIVLTSGVGVVVMVCSWVES